MRCKELRFDLVDYAKGMLSDDDKKRIERHISECEKCREELEEIRNTAVVLDSYRVELPDEPYFINFLPKLNQKIDNRKREPFFKKATKYALSFSTMISVIIVTVILLQSGNRQFIPGSDGFNNGVISESVSDISINEESEPKVINYENYVHEDLLSKIADESGIEKKATEALAVAAINSSNDIFSFSSSESYVEDLSDNEIDKVIEKLKTKNIIQ